MLTFLLLKLIHLLLEICMILAHKCHFVYIVIKSFIINVTPNFDDTKHRLQTRLSNLPSHIGLIIVERDISLVDISNIITWNISAGISFISVYDNSGIIKEKQNILEKLVTSRCHKKNYANIHVQFTKSKNILLKNGLNGTNGHSKVKKVNVCLLCSKDGRSDIIDTTRYLCKAADCGLIEPDKLLPKTFASHLTALDGFPDPDLLIRFGKTDTVSGYLPWQMRLSEILSFPSHKNIMLRDFVDILEKYTNCEKRWGR